MNRGVRRLLCGGGSIVAAVVLAAPPAAAAGEVEVAVEGGGPIFALENLAPGMTGAREVLVTNRSNDDAEVFVRVVDLVEDDNGCNRPEERAGDTTCGAGGGELGADLLITVSDGGAPLVTGTVRDLTSAQILGRVLDAGEQVALTFAWEFEFGSGNETQTDRLGFDVEIGLSQVTGGDGGNAGARGAAPSSAGGTGLPGPAGARAGDPAGPGDGPGTQVAGVVRPRAATTVVGAALPRTGASLARLAAAGIALVALGAVVRQGLRVGPALRVGPTAVRRR